MDEYKDFTKQDLLDRRNALNEEWKDNWERNTEIELEMIRINKLLEEKK